MTISIESYECKKSLSKISIIQHEIAPSWFNLPKFIKMFPSITWANWSNVVSSCFLLFKRDEFIMPAVWTRCSLLADACVLLMLRSHWSDHLCDLISIDGFDYTCIDTCHLEEGRFQAPGSRHDMDNFSHPPVICCRTFTLLNDHHISTGNSKEDWFLWQKAWTYFCGPR